MLPAPSRILGALWDFRDDAAATPSRRSSRPSSASAVGGAGGRRRPSRWTPGAASGGRSSRCSSTSQTIPVVAIAPLFVLWFGFGLLPKVLVVVLVTFFPIVVALLDGFGRRRARRPTCCVVWAPAGQAFRKLRWPSALPAFFTGLRIAAMYAVIGAVFGEYVGATEGSGSGCSSRRTASGRTSCSRRSW